MKINCLNELIAFVFPNLSFSSSVSFRSLPRAAETDDPRSRNRTFTHGCGLKSSTGGPLPWGWTLNLTRFQWLSESSIPLPLDSYRETVGSRSWTPPVFSVLMWSEESYYSSLRNFRIPINLRNLRVSLLPWHHRFLFRILLRQNENDSTTLWVHHFFTFTAPQNGRTARNLISRVRTYYVHMLSSYPFWTWAVFVFFQELVYEVR